MDSSLFKKMFFCKMLLIYFYPIPTRVIKLKWKSGSKKFWSIKGEDPLKASGLWFFIINIFNKKANSIEKHRCVSKKYIWIRLCIQNVFRKGGYPSGDYGARNGVKLEKPEGYIGSLRLFRCLSFLTANSKRLKDLLTPMQLS